LLAGDLCSSFRTQRSGDPESSGFALMKGLQAGLQSPARGKRAPGVQPGLRAVYIEESLDAPLPPMLDAD
jgi:hypothetical protein